ncbi:hypothetical protein GCM10028821_44580 [Hymenobacter jeollabukensis]
MYCFIDDLLTAVRPTWAPAPDPRQHLSDAEVLTTALVGARFFGGNLAAARRYMQGHWGQRTLDKSGFSRQLHQLQDVLDELFATFGQLLKALHTEARYVIDSFPVPVCHNTRIPRCKLLTGKAYHGRSASKRCWFYGVKVQVVTTTDGLPVAYHIHPGSEADMTGLRQLGPDLPAGSVLYADAAYTDYAHEDVFAEATGSAQHTARRRNSKRPHAPARAFLIQHFRHGIETCFGQLTDRFPKRIHATSAAGFALKIGLFVFVQALDRFGL